MAAEYVQADFPLAACRELLEAHPESLRIREQVEALEEAMPDRPGVVVSFCRTIIETTCKTILTDRSVPVDSGWEAPKSPPPMSGSPSVTWRPTNTWADGSAWTWNGRAKRCKNGSRDRWASIRSTPR